VAAGVEGRMTASLVSECTGTSHLSVGDQYNWKHAVIWGWGNQVPLCTCPSYVELAPYL